MIYGPETTECYDCKKSVNTQWNIGEEEPPVYSINLSINMASSVRDRFVMVCRSCASKRGVRKMKLVDDGPVKPETGK